MALLLAPVVSLTTLLVSRPHHFNSKAAFCVCDWLFNLAGCLFFSCVLCCVGLCLSCVGLVLVLSCHDMSYLALPCPVFFVVCCLFLSCRIFVLKPTFLFVRRSVGLSVGLSPDIKASRGSTRPSGFQSHQPVSCEGVFSSTYTLVCVFLSLLSFTSCLVLHCLALSCLVLPCLLPCVGLSDLSCLVLSCLVLSCLTFSPFLDVSQPSHVLEVRVLTDATR
jgi:hypothetical protein